jgi:hypothetical protein
MIPILVAYWEHFANMGTCCLYYLYSSEDRYPYPERSVSASGRAALRMPGDVILGYHVMPGLPFYMRHFANTFGE